jgi:zinc transport system substrate-binding protein
MKLILLAALVAVALTRAATATPVVVVSLKPLHSLVAMVMEGVATPALLLPTATSPHVYTLRPSDARLLSGADLVVWGGRSLETFLEKPISAAASRARIVSLVDEAGLDLLPLREAGAADEHAAAAGGFDMHFWLDVDNALHIVRTVAEVLAAADPTNAGRYWANAQESAAQLILLDRELDHLLAPVAGKPFLTLHDAFQYFEVRYGLATAGTLTVNAERLPGARTITQLRDTIVAAKVGCIIGEQQFPPALARTLTDGTGATVRVVDVLGIDLPAGPAAYPAMLRRLAADFRACLSGTE